MGIKVQKVLQYLCCLLLNHTYVSLSRSSFTLLTNTHNVLVSIIFRLVGYCSVALLLNKELGKVKYCTIENHLYLLLALIGSRHRQQDLQIQGKMRLTQIKESQTKENGTRKQKTRLSCAV